MTDAPRSFSLGRDGERSWRQLSGAYRLDAGTGRALLVASSRETQAELRRRLEALGPLTRIRCGPAILDEVWALAEATTPGSVPIAWLEAPAHTESDAAWARALIALNRGRDLISDRGPVFLVLAGDERLHALVAQHAPDLHHVLSPIVWVEDQPEALIQSTRPLAWLHVSDLHIDTGDWRQDVVLEALVRDLPGLLDHAELRPQLLFVTGDVTRSGQAAQYAGARAFLDALRDALDIDQLFVVPGNHDVDRGAIGPVASDARCALMSLDHDARRRRLGDIVGSPDFEIFGRRLAAWCAFTEQLDQGVSVGAPWRHDLVSIAGLELGVASLCSVWLSGPEDDQRKLIVGERQLREVIAALAESSPQLKVALLHHPHEWLDVAEAHTIEALLDEHFDLVLHGHTHVRDARVVSRGSRRAIWIGAGAAYDPHGGDRWHGVFAGRLDPGAEQIDLHAFTYTSHEGGRWHADASFERDTGAVRRVALRAPQLGQPRAVGAARLDALAARIRRSAARVYEAHSFIGLPDSAPKPATKLTSIYVPPSFTLTQRPMPFLRGDHTLASAEPLFTGLFTGEAQGPDELLECLTTRDPSERRFVILGAPGSGKSTLCRYVALRTAEHTELIPLLLRVRDWPPSRTFDLIELATLHVNAELSVRVDAETIAELFRSQEVLLLIDGIDELGQDARTRLRDTLHGFLVEYPGVGLLATSRELGYDEVSLDPRELWHLALRPFDDAQLREFVDRFYASAIPDDAELRARQRARLNAALDAEPRAKELARTPLLATLIGLVHWHRSELPGRRVRLYELCVELLVVTWPAATDRVVNELPGEWQVARLEQLALWMQQQRGTTDASAGVSISGEVLETKLGELLGDRVTEDSARRRLARRWLRWLLDAGVLHEQRRGHHGFLHLTLMEYLAGRALLREQMAGGHRQVADFVLQHHREPQWTECLLLMLGGAANDRELCVCVVEALLRASHHGATGLFLLACMREEVQLPDDSRTKILDRITAPWPPKLNGDYGRASLASLLRFGAEHGPATARWLEAQLLERRGRALLGVFVVLPEDFPLPPGLADRDPDDMDLAPTMELGDIDRWGQWALEHASPATWLRWMSSTEVDGVLDYALMGVDEAHDPNAASCIVGLLRRASWLARAAPPGLPAGMRWHAAQCTVEVPLTLAYASKDTRARARRRADPTHGSPELPQALAASLGSPHGSLTEPLIGPFRWFCLGFLVHAHLVASTSLEGTSARDAVLLSSEYVELTANTLVGEGVDSPPDTGVTPGVGATLEPCATRPRRPPPTQTPSLPWLVDDALPDRIPSDWPMRLTLFASYHAGLLRGHSSVESSRHAHAHAHNMWLNLLFDGLVESARAGGQLCAHQHALLLALGLAQFQTTWRWPLSDHWQSWFADGGPPSHWLAAHVWHLCWAVAEPEDPSHLERAEASLGDNDWPELAEAMREFSLDARSPEVDGVT